MPPKARISKEMVIEAGLAVVRREGADRLNVRSVAAELNCSTQPVMYHYDSVSGLQADVYAAADELHTKYITEADGSAENPVLAIGLRYIRFAAEERHLFRFLFQSDRFRSKSFAELLDGGGRNPVIQPLCEATGLTPEQAGDVFARLFFCVHGAASLLANNSMEYDEEYLAGLLKSTFFGAIAATKRGNYNDKTV